MPGEKEQQLRFQARLLDAVGQSVIATDLEGKVIHWNRGAKDLYGWSSEEALGRRLRDLTLPEESLDLADEIDSELRAGRAWTGETLLRRKDGSHVPVLGTATPLFDERGNLEVLRPRWIFALWTLCRPESIPDMKTGRSHLHLVAAPGSGCTPRPDRYPVAPNLPKGATVSTIDFKDLIQHANRKSSATKE